MTSDSILRKGIIKIYRNIRVNAHLNEIRQHFEGGKVQFEKCDDELSWIRPPKDE